MHTNFSRMRFNTKQVSLYELLQMIDVGRFEYKSYFKLPSRWNSRIRSQMIESIILGVPNEEIWAEEDKYGQINILSGIDIISTLIEFKEGRFKLKGLRYLHELDGIDFHDLRYSLQDELFESPLNLHILHYNLDPLIKCLFLKDINKVKLGRVSNQVARNLSFRKADERLRDFSSYIFEKYVKKSLEKQSLKEFDSFVLSFQEDLLLFVLLNFLRDGKVYDKNRSDEWNYQRDNEYDYRTHHKAMKILIDDQLDIALDKIMLEIDTIDNFGDDELNNVFHSVQKILDDDGSHIEQVGVLNRMAFSNRQRNGLFEVMYDKNRFPSIRSEISLRQLGRKLDL
jgi:hypothetical protein